MQEVVAYYCATFARVNPQKTKDNIVVYLLTQLALLNPLKKGSGTLQIDLELAAIKILDLHLKTQIAVEMDIYEAADVNCVSCRSTETEP